MNHKRNNQCIFLHKNKSFKKQKDGGGEVKREAFHSTLCCSCNTQATDLTCIILSFYFVLVIASLSHKTTHWIHLMFSLLFHHFKKYILLIMLLQLSHFPPFTPLSPQPHTQLDHSGKLLEFFTAIGTRMGNSASLRGKQYINSS